MVGRKNNRYELAAGVCPKEVLITTNDDKIVNIKFAGGCEGNLEAIRLLTKGMEVDAVINLLSNTKCGKKATSCTAELCKLLTKMKSE